MSPRARALALAVALALTAWAAPAARAHELEPCYLELRQTGPESYDVFWKVPRVGGLRELLLPRFPDGARVLGERAAFEAGGAWIERLRIARPGGLDGERVMIRGLELTGTDVLVRVVRLDGGTQTARLTPAETSFAVEPAQGWLAALWTYAVLGVEHILLGVDHLLFVLGLVLIVRGRGRLVGTISAFTLAHSLTLAAATLGWARAPLAPLNAAIALSILFLGPEIARSWRTPASAVTAEHGTSLTLRRPWLVAFAFGLLHGFGFASGLAALGLSPPELALGLFGFNVGVELGQLGFVALALALARSFRVLELCWPVWALRLPGYAVGVCGAWWTIQRTAALLLGA